MQSAKYNMTIEQGAVFSRTISWKNAYGTDVLFTTAGGGTNVSGYKIDFFAKDKIDGSVVLFGTWSEGPNPLAINITVSEDKTRFTIGFSAIETAAIPVSSMIYNIKLTPWVPLLLDEDNAFILIRGNISVVREVGGDS